MKFLLFLFTVLLSVSSLAEVKMSALFSDGMVLQQKQAVPVWGWAPAGTAVSVSFAGQTKETKADNNGKWMLKLDALTASAKGAEMTVKVGSESKTIKDILVGEVWICSGQSNMDFTMAQISKDARDKRQQPIPEYVAKETQTAKDSLYRQIAVPRMTSAFKESTGFQGKWLSVDPQNTPGFTATGYFFGRELRKKLNVPVGLIKCAWGGTRVEPWVPMSKFQSNDALKQYYDAETSAIKEQLAKWDDAKVKANYEKQVAKWKETVKKLKDAGKKKFPRKPRMAGKPDKRNTIPSTLYNGMIYQLAPFAVKGAIWYQGESNRKHMPEKYEQHFSALIEAWREVWAQDKFYFYWCQLAQFQAPNAEPLSEDAWTDVCNAQRLVLKLKDTGMAVLNDIGEAGDIHPRNKVDAGKRLSLWAFKQAYGETDLVSSGPLYKSHTVEGSKFVIKFDSAGSGLMVGKKNLLDPTVPADGPLKRFQICGEDKVWKWADAKITGKDTVEVSHKDIAKPVEVRYAWSPNAEGANLYNKEGLPASLFKTK